MVGASGHDVNSLSETGRRPRTFGLYSAGRLGSACETGRAAYIFTRSSGWQQQVRALRALRAWPGAPLHALAEAKLLANDTMAGDRFGVAVAVTEEGHVLVPASGPQVA